MLLATFRYAMSFRHVAAFVYDTFRYALIRRCQRIADARYAR